MRKSEDFVALIFGVVLVLIILGILVILAKQSNTPRQTAVSPTPIATPAPTISPQDGKPPVSYDEKAEKNLLDRFENRQPLSHNDGVAKANILSLLPEGQQSGAIYANSVISIEYIHSADLFQVEILTTNIKSAKDAANVWFRSHGLSQNAICTLPIEFYLNYAIANQLRQANITFSPLGNGCSQ